MHRQNNGIPEVFFEFYNMVLIRSTFGEDSLCFFQPVGIYEGHLEEVFFIHLLLQFFLGVGSSFVKREPWSYCTIEILASSPLEVRYVNFTLKLAWIRENKQFLFPLFAIGVISGMMDCLSL